MSKKRMTATTSQTGQVVLFRTPLKTAPVLCEQCACGMLLLEEAVAVSQLSSREIYRRVEAATLHFVESSDGLLLICLKSLMGGHE